MTAATGRPRSQHTEVLNMRVHPDLKAWVMEEAQRTYSTEVDVVRRLIVEAMRAENGCHRAAP